MISEKVIRIRLGFVNAYLLVQGQHAAIIDGGFPGHARRIIRAAERHGVTPGMVRLIIITHGHVDHAGGVPALQAWCGAPCAMHGADVALLHSQSDPTLKATSWPGKVMAASAGLAVSPRVPHFRPDILLQDSDSLAPYRLEARILHTPGHTPGSISVVTAQHQALVGDLFLVRPAVWRITIPFFVDDWTAYNASIARMQELAPRRLYAAHWGLTTGQAFGAWAHKRGAHAAGH